MQGSIAFLLLVFWHFPSYSFAVFSSTSSFYFTSFHGKRPPPPAPPPAPNKAFPYQPPCRLTFASKVTQCSIGGPFSMEDGGIRLYRLRNFQVQPTHRVIGICGYGHWCVMCVFFETRVNHQLMAYSLHWSLWVHQLID